MKRITVITAVVALLALAIGCRGAQTALGSGANVQFTALKDIGSGDFDAEVLQATGPVIVDFFATWCEPCKRLTPILDEIAAERSDKLKVVRVDVDKSGDLAHKYNIEAMPTLVLFYSGQEVKRWVGLMDKGELAAEIDATLKNLH